MDIRHSQTGRRAGVPITRLAEARRAIWRVYTGRKLTHRKETP